MSERGCAGPTFDAAAEVDGVLVTVRRGKTNQEGETRFVKGGVARALRDAQGLHEPGAGGPRCAALAEDGGAAVQCYAARAAGIEQVTAHSGRVGLASELTSRRRVDHRRDTRRELEDEPG